MKLFVFLLLWCISASLIGQTVLENNPPGLQWYQVNSPNFNVLFPKGFDAQALRVANTLEHIRSAEANSLGVVPRKISIILQNQSAVSNGFVSMFPPRSEFYTMPSQNYNFIGTNDWLNLLASHEYRHIVQYRHASRGFTRFVYYLFGNPTFSALAHAGAPDWFWEGDAVATETAFTPGGRGRIPNFGLLMRTNLLEGRTFNYHKQYLRSYKHNIPNHYVLGYYMVSYLRRKTNDPDIWEKITARSWNVPFIPFSFSNAIKNKTGLYVTDLYREMAKELKNEWQAQIDSLSLSSFETVNKRSSKAYTDYLFPQPQLDGSVLVRKEGIGDIERFVLIKDGKEKKVFTPGFINDAGTLSSGRDIIVWNEFGFDPRWQVRNYSLIKAYDRKNKVKFVVSEKNARYGSAAISPDGKYILTVRSDQNYNHQLLVLRYPDGKIERAFPNPQNDFFMMPGWSDDGERIITLKNTPKGKTISVIDFRSGETRDILPVTHENVGYPVLHGKYAFFNSPATGIDNIHVIELQSGKRYQVTESRLGSYNPSVSPDQRFVYYNEQTRNGMDVVRIPFEPSEWKLFSPKPNVKTFYQHLVEQEGSPNLFDSIPQKQFPIRKYSRWKHIINPFSWGVFVENDLATVDIGITSRDILSTTSLNAGYTYDINEGTAFWRAGLSYQGLYPIIDVNFRKGSRAVDEGRATTVIVRGDDTTRVTNQMRFTWQEENISAGFRIPLITTSSKYSGGITISNEVGVTRVYDFSNTFLNDRIFPTFIRNDTIFQGFRFLDYVSNGTLIYNYFNLSGQRLLKRSARDILPRFGQTFNIRYYSTPFGGDFDGGVASAVGYLYLPGLGKHHSLYGYATVQRVLNPIDAINEEGTYFFRNTVPLPRGLSVARFKRFYSGSVNYTLPLWYPDIAVGPVLNIQRFRLNLFGDYAFGDHSMVRGTDVTYGSVGGELTVDFNIMRFLPQFDIGVRYSYGITPRVQNVELVIGTFNF